MEKNIEDLIEGAETDEEGLTNDVYFTDEYVIKRYSRYPFTSFLMSMTNIFSGFEYYSRRRRMSNEVKTKQLLEQNSPVSVPQVIDKGEEYLVFENVEGESGFEYINEGSRDEAFELGQRLSNLFEEIHSQDITLRDSRLSNFLVEGEKIYSIDHEYADLQSNWFLSSFDGITLMASARQTSNYRPLKEGFSPSKVSMITSFFLALDHAVLLERDSVKIRNVLSSLKEDLYF